MRSYFALLFAALSVGASLFFPLWHLHLIAPQYQEGLDLYIYSHKIDAGGLNGNGRSGRAGMGLFTGGQLDFF